jgi:hypothetical protein
MENTRNLHTNVTQLFKDPQNQRQSQSHVTTDGQSTSQSWCQAPSGGQYQIFDTVRQLRFRRCGAPSLLRGQSVIYCCHSQ